jgi:hypothetical protein
MKDSCRGGWVSCSKNKEKGWWYLLRATYGKFTGGMRIENGEETPLYNIKPARLLLLIMTE